MREFLLEDAQFVGLKAEEANKTKIPDVADMKPLREMQEELGIVCERGYGCKR